MEITTMPELRAAYPQHSEFIERMYVSWMRFLGGTKGDERPAAQSFVKNLTEVAPDEPAIQHLVVFSRENSTEGISPYATACWLVLVGSDPRGEEPEVDKDLFIRWRDSRPTRL